MEQTIEIYPKTSYAPYASHAYLNPTLVIKVKINAFNINTVKALKDNFINQCETLIATNDLRDPCNSNVNDNNPQKEFFDELFDLIHCVQHTCNFGVYEVARIIGGNHGIFNIIIPTPGIEITLEKEIYFSVLRWFNLTNEQMPTAKDLRIFTSVHNKFKSGSNVVRFIRAATQANIPFMRLDKQFIRYGHANKACWMESTFTENTSIIGSKIARNKWLSSKLLAQSGLPVCPKYPVSDFRQALHFVKNVGYPVVLKPSALDGGQGVVANIQSQSELQAAYNKILKISRAMLIEKHVAGKDYRIQVVFGKAVWTVLREPPFVTGDGEASMASLIANYNSLRLEQNKENLALKPININPSIIAHLSKQSLTLESIPVIGQKVSINSIANVNTGGVPIGITDNIHPDNLLLAEQAAECLNLDIAGVDIIIEDISQSWQHNDAIICEVNAQPQFGYTSQQHLYTETLNKMLPTLGRVPVIVVIGDASELDWINTLQTQLNDVGVQLGVFSEFSKSDTITNTFIQKDTIATGLATLLGNKKIGAALVHFESLNLLSNGFGIDRFNTAVISSSLVSRSNAHKGFVEMLKSNALTKTSLYVDSSSREKGNTRMIDKTNETTLSVNDVLSHLTSEICSQI